MDIAAYERKENTVREEEDHVKTIFDSIKKIYENGDGKGLATDILKLSIGCLIFGFAIGTMVEHTWHMPHWWWCGVLSCTG